MTIISPLQKYQQQIQSGQLQADVTQTALIKQLDTLFHTIQQQQKFVAKIFHRKSTLKGLYIWGGVGIGKTRMMDIFYDCLPTSRKLRIHLHHFMRMLHQQLAKFQGEINPLHVISQQFAAKFDVICFDEFTVSNIADAMLLAGFFQPLLLHIV